VTFERVFYKAGRTISKRRTRMTGPYAGRYNVLIDYMTRCRRMDKALGDGW